MHGIKRLESCISGRLSRNKISSYFHLSEFLSKFKAKILHRRQGSKNSLLPLAARYLYANALLRPIIANLHGDSLSTCIRNGDHVIIQIVINRMSAGITANHEAGFAGRASVAKNFSASVRLKGWRGR